MASHLVVFLPLSSKTLYFGSPRGRTKTHLKIMFCYRKRCFMKTENMHIFAKIITLSHKTFVFPFTTGLVMAGFYFLLLQHETLHSVEDPGWQPCGTKTTFLRNWGREVPYLCQIHITRISTRTFDGQFPMHPKPSESHDRTRYFALGNWSQWGTRNTNKVLECALLVPLWTD